MNHTFYQQKVVVKLQHDGEECVDPSWFVIDGFVLSPMNLLLDISSELELANKKHHSQPTLTVHPQRG